MYLWFAVIALPIFLLIRKARRFYAKFKDIPHTSTGSYVFGDALEIIKAYVGIIDVPLYKGNYSQII
jgi:hypothetical protein